MYRLKFVLTGAVMALLLAFPGAGLAATQKVYAKVNGADLTQLDYNEAYNEIIPWASYHRMMPYQIAKYKPKIIERMLENELCYQEALRVGLKMPDQQLAREKQYVIGSLGGPKGFENWLAQNGISASQYWALLEKGWLIKALKKKEIDDKAAVSEQEARAYYEKKKNTFFRPEAMRLSEITIKVDPAASDKVWEQKEKYAEKILDKIKKGADFGDMAWDYSEDDWRVKEGDRGIVHKGMLEDEDLEKKVFKLQAGQVSPVIRTIYGYNIVKVTQVFPPQQLSFNDVKQSIINDLESSRREQLKDSLMKRLKQSARIEMPDGK